MHARTHTTKRRTTQGKARAPGTENTAQKRPPTKRSREHRVASAMTDPTGVQQCPRRHWVRWCCGAGVCAVRVWGRPPCCCCCCPGRRDGGGGGGETVVFKKKASDEHKPRGLGGEAHTAGTQYATPRKKKSTCKRTPWLLFFFFFGGLVSQKNMVGSLRRRRHTHRGRNTRGMTQTAAVCTQ